MQVTAQIAVQAIMSVAAPARLLMADEIDAEAITDRQRGIAYPERPRHLPAVQPTPFQHQPPRRA
jgi:hypothetical protein